MNKILDVNWGIHLLEIEITYRCNLDCKHCYNRYETIKDMPLNTIIEQINIAAEQGVEKLIITGGEACLHPEFEKLCEYIIENRTKLNGIKCFVLQSNGFSKKMSDNHFKAFDVVHLSYDLNNSNIRIINKNNLFNLAKRLQNLDIYSYFFVTVTKENMNKIDDIVKDLNQNNIPLALNLCTSNNKNEEYLLTKSEKKEIYRKIISLEEQGKIRPFKHPYNCIFKNQKSINYIGNRGGCTAGIASCSIKATGDVIPCPFLRVSAGSIYSKSLNDIWKSSELFMKLRKRNHYNKCGECKHISYCGGCRKSALETSGAIDGYDAGCIL